MVVSLGRRLGRRAFLARAGASITALAAAAPLRAQLAVSASDLEKLIGRKLPQPLTALLPQEVFEGASFVRRLMALETQAKVLRLPPSVLPGSDGLLSLDPDRLYEFALPRAVALIDRSEFRNLPFANKAGELLALLHRSQHVVPEGFASAGQEGSSAGFLSISVQPGPPPPLVLPRLETSSAAPAPADPDEDPAPVAVNRSIRFDAISEEYAAQFRAATLKPEHQASFDWHLAMIRKAKTRYQGIETATGVPWYFVAVVHGMEASFNFRAHLHNGDYPLSQRTRQVPSGRPLRWLPPSDWDASAGDALRLMGFTGAQDWSLPRLLHRLEAFNGFGYRRIGKPSPYLWSFTSNYDRGKYVADGKYNPKARSQQCGGAAMVKLLEAAGEVSFA